jgi:predicted nucleic acid-binding protein
MLAVADAALLVVDASVIFKWFVSAEEDALDSARQILLAHTDGRLRLVTPALAVHELLNVLSRGGRGAPGLAEAMGAFFDSDVTLVSPDRDLMTRGADHISRLGVSAFDSAYSALAETLGCELATADRKLARRLDGTVSVHLL